jgi:hypothetical protein
MSLGCPTGHDSGLRNLGLIVIKRNSRIPLASDPQLRGVLYQEETKSQGFGKINYERFFS